MDEESSSLVIWMVATRFLSANGARIQGYIRIIAKYLFEDLAGSSRGSKEMNSCLWKYFASYQCKLTTVRTYIHNIFTIKLSKTDKCSIPAAAPLKSAEIREYPK